MSFCSAASSRNAGGSIRRPWRLAILIVGLIAGVFAGPAVFAAFPGMPATKPAPASSTPTLDQSLDQVISTLKNDQSRAALLADLEALKAAQQKKVATKPAAASLIGAVGNLFASFTQHFRDNEGPLHYWEGQFAAASEDLAALLSGDGGEPRSDTLMRFLITLAEWAIVAAPMLGLGWMVARRMGVKGGLPPSPTARQAVGFAVRWLLPWIVSFSVVLHALRLTTPSLGRVLALMLCYGTLAGAELAAICMVLFSLFGSGHRRAAVRVLLRRAPPLLFGIGFLGAIGDVTQNLRLQAIIGEDLAQTLSAIADIAAAMFTIVFALRFRRPVAFLFRGSSPYARQQQAPLSADLLNAVASVWHVALILLAGLSSIVTVLYGGGNSSALRNAAATVAALVLVGLLSTVLHRVLNALTLRWQGHGGGPAIYLARVLQVVRALLNLALWLGFAEIVAQLWNFSLFRLATVNVGSRTLGDAFGSLFASAISAWVIWIFVDTAIQQAMKPSRRRPLIGVRALTLLPLMRNVALIGIIIVTLVSALSHIGLNVAPLIASAGVIGLAVGFGAQTLVQDIITGLFIIIEDTIAIGDAVDVGGHAGSVEGLSLRTLRLRDGNGALHTIPFSQIKAVTNQSRQFGMAVFKIAITLGSNIEDALRIIRETGDEVKDDPGVIGPLELFGVDSVGGGVVNLLGQMRTLPLQQYGLMRHFNQVLKAKIDACPTVAFAGTVLPTKVILMPDVQISAAPTISPPGDSPPANAPAEGSVVATLPPSDAEAQSASASAGKTPGNTRV